MPLFPKAPMPSFGPCPSICAISFRVAGAYSSGGLTQALFVLIAEAQLSIDTGAFAEQRSCPIGMRDHLLADRMRPGAVA